MPFDPQFLARNDFSHCHKSLNFASKHKACNSPNESDLSLDFFMSFQCSVTPCRSSRLEALVATGVDFVFDKLGGRCGGPICRDLPLTRALFPTSKWFIAGDGDELIVWLAQAASEKKGIDYFIPIRFPVEDNCTWKMITEWQSYYRTGWCELGAVARTISRTAVSRNLYPKPVFPCRCWRSKELPLGMQIDLKTWTMFKECEISGFIGEEVVCHIQGRWDDLDWMESALWTVEGEFCICMKFGCEVSLYLSISV